MLTPPEPAPLWQQKLVFNLNSSRETVEMPASSCPAVICAFIRDQRLREAAADNELLLDDDDEQRLIQSRSGALQVHVNADASARALRLFLATFGGDTVAKMTGPRGEADVPGAGSSVTIQDIHQILNLEEFFKVPDATKIEEFVCRTIR